MGIPFVFASGYQRTAVLDVLPKAQILGKPLQFDALLATVDRTPPSSRSHEPPRNKRGSSAVSFLWNGRFGRKTAPEGHGA